MDRCFDEFRNVVDDLQLNSWRQLRAQFLHLGSYVVRNAHRVHAGLPEHLNGNHVFGRRVLPEQRGPGAKLLRSVFHLSNVPHAHGRSTACANHDFAELFRGRDAPQSPQAQLHRAGNHAPAGSFDIFPLQGFAHVQHRKIVCGQLLRIEQNAYLPRLPAIQVHAPHAVHGLDGTPHLFVGDFCQFAAAHRPAHE